MKKNADSEANPRNELRKRVLERWENEGGTVGGEPSKTSVPRKPNKKNKQGSSDIQPESKQGK